MRKNIGYIEDLVSGPYETINKPGIDKLIKRYVWYNKKEDQIYSTHPDPKHSAYGINPYNYWLTLKPGD